MNNSKQSKKWPIVVQVGMIKEAQCIDPFSKCSEKLLTGKSINLYWKFTLNWQTRVNRDVWILEVVIRLTMWLLLFGSLLKWYYVYNTDRTDGGAVDDVRKFNATDISFYMQPNRHRRKFALLLLFRYIVLPRLC